MSKTPSTAALKEIELLGADVRELSKRVRAASNTQKWAHAILVRHVLALAAVLLFVAIKGRILGSAESASPSPEEPASPMVTDEVARREAATSNSAAPASSASGGPTTPTQDSSSATPAPSGGK